LYIVLNGVGESWPAGGWLRARSWMGFQSGTSLNHLGRSLFTVHNRRLWFVDWLGGKGDKFGEAWMNRKKKDARCWSTGYVYFNKFAVNLLLQTQKKVVIFILIYKNWLRNAIDCKKKKKKSEFQWRGGWAYASLRRMLVVSLRRYLRVW
jgi:hypothetical protein